MPKTADDATRVRDNQRRSRARRKDLIKDLQTRVQEYEFKGIAATQEMQRAARKVAQENERLRNLLARHGVLEGEINAYLQSFDSPASLGDTEVAVVRIKNAGSEHTPVPQTPNRMYYDGGRAPSVQGPVADRSFQASYEQPVQRPQAQPTLQHIISAQVIPNNPCAITNTCAPISTCAPANTCASTNSCANPGTSTQLACPPQPRTQPWIADKTSYNQTVLEDPDCPSTADCFCPPTATTAPQESRSGLEISCEAAATIIAQMRGDGDRIAAKASLGCKSDEQCTIRNSTLMQILDER